MSNKLAQQAILDFQQGDEKAFELIFREHYRPLVVFAKKIIGSLDEAQDIAQEVLLSLFKRHNLFKDLNNIRAFLYISARNRCFNYLKANKRHGVRNLEFADWIKDDTLLAYEYLIKTEILAALHAAIENLPEECRKVFKLLYYDELKPAAVAKLLQISVNTVYVQKSRALSMLRLKLSEIPVIISWLIQVISLLPVDLHYLPLHLPL